MRRLVPFGQAVIPKLIKCLAVGKNEDVVDIYFLPSPQKMYLIIRIGGLREENKLLLHLPRSPEIR